MGACYLESVKSSTPLPGTCLTPGHVGVVPIPGVIRTFGPTRPSGCHRSWTGWPYSCFSGRPCCCWRRWGFPMDGWLRGEDLSWRYRYSRWREPSGSTSKSQPWKNMPTTVAIPAPKTRETRGDQRHLSASRHGSAWDELWLVDEIHRGARPLACTGHVASHGPPTGHDGPAMDLDVVQGGGQLHDQ